MYKIWQYPQQVRLTAFTSTQQQSSLCWHSTLNGKVHLPFSNQPSYFLPHPVSSMSSSASLWPSTSKSNAPLKTWPSSLHNKWPYKWTLFAIANWSVVSFKPSMNIKSVDPFLYLSCTPQHCSPWIIPSFVKFPSHFHSGTMLHFYTVLPALHNSYKNLFRLR